MSKSSELIKKTGIISIGRISTQIVNFLLLPLYTAYLATEDYGNFDYIVSISAFLVPVMTMLVEESMFRFLIDANDENDKREIITHTFVFCVINTGVIGVVFYFLWCAIGLDFGIQILLYSVGMCLLALSNAISRGLGLIWLYSLSNFIISTLVIVMNLVFIISLHWGIEALLLSSIIANTVVALLVLCKLRIWKYLNFRCINRTVMGKMLKYSIPLVPNTVSWSIINMSDRLFIISYLGASINGLYTVAYKFPNLLFTFFSFFSIAWREVSAKIVKDHDYNEFKKIYSYIKNGLFAATILLISIIRFVYPLFVNSAYQESIEYVPLLAISVYYLCLAAFYGGIYTAYMDTKEVGTTAFVAAIINLTVDFILIKLIGIYAAIISTLVAALFMYIYRKIKMKRYFKANDRTDYLYFIYFIILVRFFYQNGPVFNYIGLALSMIVSVLLNKDTLFNLFGKIRKRIMS